MNEKTSNIIKIVLKVIHAIARIFHEKHKTEKSDKENISNN